MTKGVNAINHQGCLHKKYTMLIYFDKWVFTLITYNIIVNCANKSEMHILLKQNFKVVWALTAAFFYLIFFEKEVKQLDYK